MKILIQAASKPAAPQTIRLAPSTVTLRARPLRVLDFDCECRPLHFYGDYVSKEITAIAWAWVDAPADVTCLLLGEMELPDMLAAFTRAWDEADLVTGHFIRGFDIPLIQGALTEQRMPTLRDKMTHDTKLDLVRRHGISGSQENIGSMLGLSYPKVGMNQTTWRAANRLTPDGLEEVRKRAIGDVQQHIEMRAKLLELGYLAAPKKWRGGSARAEDYTP
jgi:hypothetical protein